MDNAHILVWTALNIVTVAFIAELMYNMSCDEGELVHY